jgi:hypothetical protein
VDNGCGSGPDFGKDDVIGSLTLARKEKARSSENEAVAQDGQTLPRDQLSPVYMASANSASPSCVDVTEQWLARKQAERQNFDLDQGSPAHRGLEQAERRLIAAINSASEGFAAFDWTASSSSPTINPAAAPVSLWCGEE